MLHQQRRHLLRSDHEVAGPGLDGAGRHGVELGRLGALHQDQAPRLVNLPDPLGAVLACAGHDYRTGPIPGLARQRGQEEIDGTFHVPVIRGGGQGQESSLLDLHLGHRPVQIDGVAHQLGLLGYLVHRHPGMAAEQAFHLALEVGGQVLDDDEGDA